MNPLLRSFLPNARAINVAAIDDALLGNAALVVFDVDNTLVVPESVEAPDTIRQRVNEIAKQKRCVLVSNSRTLRRRSKKLQELFGCEVFFGHGRKPFKRLFRELCVAYHVRPEEVVIVGDRLWSDVWFAKRNGAYSILVEPLTSHEVWYIKIVRRIERLILRI